MIKEILFIKYEYCMKIDENNLYFSAPVPPEQAPAESVRNASPEYKLIEKIIRKYGGVLTQESLEEGCCFKIVLPLAQ